MKRIWLVLTLFGLLTGCAAQRQAPAANERVEPDQPVQYFVCSTDRYKKSCVVSSDGRVLVPLSAKTKEVVQNAKGEFCYILTSEVVDAENGSVSNVEILDGQGKALVSVSIPLRSLDSGWSNGAYPINKGAPADRLRFSVWQDGIVSVYDGKANEVLHLSENSYILGGNEHLIMVERESRIKLYDLDGKPIETEREYAYIGYYGDVNEASCFALGYAGSDDSALCDLFSPDGKVLLRGLRDITDVGEDYVVCTRGFSCGIMDLKGNWIAKESIFTGLED